MAAIIKLCKIRNIRRYLTKDIWHQLVLSLTISHLDYGNVIFSGCPDVRIELLQKVKNTAAIIILYKKTQRQCKKNLKSLHWLQIWHRIDYKNAMLVFKSTYDMALKYIKELLSALTHITRIRRDFDIANSLRYRTGFAPMLFQWCYSHMAHFSSQICCDFFTVRFFRSRPLFIARFLFCRAIFHVQTGWALLFVLQLIVLLFVFQ